MQKALTILLIFLGTAHAAIIEGKVVNIVDGDTIMILDGQRTPHYVRINGIDAPEKGQTFGTRSRQNMANMVANKEVTADCVKMDRFRRHICVVWVQPADCPTCPKTLDVGHAQILAGLAWWYRYYAKDQTPENRDRYESAEAEAQMRKSGLWRDNAPVPPWEWRKRSKHKSVSER